MLVTAPLVAWSLLAIAQAPQTEVPTIAIQVDVIATTPLPGVGLTLDEVPAAVQTLTAKEIQASGALELSGVLNQRLSGVHVNEIQGNPFQPDVNYRGYTASPLLGTPQGLSIYMDGVRLNQPFGDVVSWDLIPRMAIASTTLMPGSNPLFGLNTLGGALSIHTKDGRSYPGTAVLATYGSHARRAVEFEHGGTSPSGWHWYLTGNLFGERGWRDDSPSDVRQAFGKLGWQDVKNDVSLTLAHANNTLNGNGLQERRFLDRDYASVYTKPDTTENRATFVNLTARRTDLRHLTMTGNVYYRNIRTNAFNGDINEDALDQSLYQPTSAEVAALMAAGYTGVPASGATAANTPFPSWRCLAQALQRDEPAEKCNGLLNSTNTAQQNYGAYGQITRIDEGDGRSNLFTMGAGYDGSRVGFLQSTQLGYLNADRTVTGVNAFGDGVTGGSVDGAPFDTRVDLDGRTHTQSLYATDTLTVAGAWHLTLSGRYNRTTIANSDRISPGGGPGSLDGTHAYARFNPSAGLTFSPSSGVNAYVAYSEGSRAPTSVELGCADPNQPCKLPNSVAGDPPLDQVITRTWDAGIRSGTGRPNRMSWNFSVFRAENRQDLLFVSAPQTGFGYFTNFGRTRRQGLALDVSGRVQGVALGAGYTYLDATYRSAETVNGTGNSTNDAAATGAKGLVGTIAIQPGDRIPLVPRHMLKAFVDVEVTPKLSIDLDLVAVSSSLARGNENNQHRPDGTYYLGPGMTPGYGVVNLGARYQLGRVVQLLAQLNNLFDRRYETAAQLGPTGFTDAGAFIARPFPALNGEFPVRQTTFYAPGAPRTFSVSTRLTF